MNNEDKVFVLVCLLLVFVLWTWLFKKKKPKPPQQYQDQEYNPAPSKDVLLDSFIANRLVSYTEIEAEQEGYVVKFPLYIGTQRQFVNTAEFNRIGNYAGDPIHRFQNMKVVATAIELACDIIIASLKFENTDTMLGIYKNALSDVKPISTGVIFENGEYLVVTHLPK